MNLHAIRSAIAELHLRRIHIAGSSQEEFLSRDVRGELDDAIADVTRLDIPATCERERNEANHEIDQARSVIARWHTACAIAACAA